MLQNFKNVYIPIYLQHKQLFGNRVFMNQPVSIFVVFLEKSVNSKVNLKFD